MKVSMLEQTIINLCDIYKQATGRDATKLYVHPGVHWLLMKEFPPVDAVGALNGLEIISSAAHPIGTMYVGNE